MNLSILLGMLGAPEIILIILGLLILFGGRKIPELMKGLGQGMREFKKASKNDDSGGTNAGESIEEKSK
jgi:sec-independent protein translocase protein TatA